MEELRMREILFRGKNAVYGEWVEGFLVKKADALYEGIKMYFILRQERGKFGMFDSGMTWIAVKPETVGQYTGLTDKNGKRIFEGDVVRYTERQSLRSETPCVHAVEYAEGGWCVDCWFLHNWLWDGVNGNNQLRDIEVIGNIHDNPELLEVER
jgi:uncharacterized phage protein (TIGR01671 family)